MHVTIAMKTDTNTNSLIAFGISKLRNNYKVLEQNISGNVHFIINHNML